MQGDDCAAAAIANVDGAVATAIQEDDRDAAAAIAAEEPIISGHAAREARSATGAATASYRRPLPNRTARERMQTNSNLQQSSRRCLARSVGKR